MPQFGRAMRVASMVLAIATLAGCGTTPTGPLAARTAYTTTPIVMVAGRPRKLGYDMARYLRLFAPKAHPVRLNRQGALPTSVDLRRYCSPVGDQGELGACTAFSIIKGLRESIEIQAGGTFVPLSALFFYYEERALTHTIPTDTGSTVTEGMGVLKATGVCPEADDPYVIQNYALAPSVQAVADAARYTVPTTTQLATLDDVKAALAAGHVVSFGFNVYESFLNIGKNGKMPMPTTDEQLVGGHAVCAVGYDDARQVLIVRNSWADTWGDHGYCYMPYAFATGSLNGKPNVAEWWTAY